MVRTLSDPNPLSDVDPKRIAGNVAVVCVHALAFALLMLPARMDAPPPAAPRETIVVEETVKPKPIPPTLPPPKPIEVEKPRPRQVVVPDVVRPELPPVDIAPVLDQGDIAAEVIDDVGPPVAEFDPAPQVQTLAYVRNPAPRYPRTALTRGIEGRVLLKVLVDANGRPIEVTIEKGSGHRDLDRAARDKVLADWLFRPAQHAGVPVPAYALVPIDFRLP